jgi:DNA-binding CsgD family transcriptional regulator
MVGVTGEQIWADRFDGTVGDVLDIQEEIARRVVGSIAPEIHFAEQRRVEHLPPGDVQAYELALKAAALIGRGVADEDEGAISDGIALATRAAALDPHCRRAYHAMAWGYCRRGVMGLFAPRAEADFAAADRAALRLRELDEHHHAAYAILGHVAMRRRRHDEALASLRQAHALNPNDVTTLRWLSWQESNFGMTEAAREHAALSLRLGPRDRAIDIGYWTMALAEYVAEERRSCLENVRRAIAINRGFAGHYILLAACLAEMGATEEAREAVAAAQQMVPGLIESRAAGITYFAVPALAQRYTRALRAAARLGASPEPERQRRRRAPAASLAPLTTREAEVLGHVAQGLSNSGIAAALSLSEHTVKRHVANILIKLGLPTRAAAVAWAAQHGLL